MANPKIVPVQGQSFTSPIIVVSRPECSAQQLAGEPSEMDPKNDMRAINGAINFVCRERDQTYKTSENVLKS
jgi:hypothetical protein